jgi:hypothetical protein
MGMFCQTSDRGAQIRSEVRVSSSASRTITALSTALRGLVARSVEQVEGEALVLEAHHRRGDRDAALALDRHPIRAHPPPLTPRLNLARQPDRPARQPLLRGGLAASGI